MPGAVVNHFAERRFPKLERLQVGGLRFIVAGNSYASKKQSSTGVLLCW